uniref:Uncharacterized protein n=1 Tax=Brassica campestris TaxID=3711 RepID=M4EQP5_BRACM
MEGEEDDYPGPESGIGGINLNGRNVGAVMVAPRDVDIASQSGCRINIYVNSNVQGTCGSALLSSKVKLRDPGVHLHIEDLKMNRDDGSRQEEDSFSCSPIGSGTMPIPHKFREGLQ